MPAGSSSQVPLQNLDLPNCNKLCHDQSFFLKPNLRLLFWDNLHAWSQTYHTENLVATFHLLLEETHTTGQKDVFSRHATCKKPSALESQPTVKNDNTVSPLWHKTVTSALFAKTKLPMIRISGKHVEKGQHCEPFWSPNIGRGRRIFAFGFELARLLLDSPVFRHIEVVQDVTCVRLADRHVPRIQSINTNVNALFVICVKVTNLHDRQINLALSSYVVKVPDERCTRRAP